MRRPPHLLAAFDRASNALQECCHTSKRMLRTVFAEQRGGGKGVEVGEKSDLQEVGQAVKAEEVEMLGKRIRARKGAG